MSDRSTSSESHYDVAIIGGGPGGSTLGTLLRKYDPDKRILIVEKEKFPRDHVGESQLPGISMVLNEMGAWDKVEAANFPVKTAPHCRMCNFLSVCEAGKKWVQENWTTDYTD